MMEFLFYLAVGVAGYLMGRSQRFERAVEVSVATEREYDRLKKRADDYHSWLTAAHTKQFAAERQLNKVGGRLGAARQKIRRMHIELRRLTPPSPKP